MENDSAFHTFKQLYTCTTGRFRSVIYKLLNLYIAKLPTFYSFCILKLLHNTCLSDHRIPCSKINFRYDVEPAKQLPSNIRAKTNASSCSAVYGVWIRRLKLLSLWMKQLKVIRRARYLH